MDNVRSPSARNPYSGELEPYLAADAQVTTRAGEFIYKESLSSIGMRV